ncbi:MAG: hypothetical protein EOO48_05200 [Flavobacterium sp.]|nr:MAG: hypothetical protein EOO48_05200 [Flavobacterium sp.]
MNGEFSQQFEQYYREDASGHLVSPAGLVIHPGNNSEFTDTREVTFSGISIGNINYHLAAPANVAVEGQSYFVYSYIGDFVPTDGVSPPNMIYDQYQQHVGLICQHCAGVSGSYFYEDRLIHYDPN